VIHPAAPNLLIAIALLAIGSALLIFNRQHARLWSTVNGRSVPTGLYYFYGYVLGPLLVVIFGVLALLSVLLVR
jgi:hypothetical protein